MKKIAFIPRHWGQSVEILNQLNSIHEKGASFNIDDASCGKVVVLENPPTNTSGWVIVDDAIPNKTDALILDYAGNIERFFPDGNLFEPQIQAYKDKPKIKDDFTCPQCSHTNTFTLRPNPDEMQYDAQGFFLNLDGERYIFDDGKQYPAHFGRRCTRVEERGLNNFERCTFFWDYKECHECGAENDIAARKCGSCKKLLIDPNNKLVGTTLDYKNDLSQIQTDTIVRMSKRATMSKSGNPMFKVFFKTPYRDFVAFFSDRVNKRFYEMLSDNNFKPKTVSYKKSSKTDFFTVVDFNRQEDVVR